MQHHCYIRKKEKKKLIFNENVILEIFLSEIYIDFYLATHFKEFKFSLKMTVHTLSNYIY